MNRLPLPYICLPISAYKSITAADLQLHKLPLFFDNLLQYLELQYSMNYRYDFQSSSNLYVYMYTRLRWSSDFKCVCRTEMRGDDEQVAFYNEDPIAWWIDWSLLHDEHSIRRCLYGMTVFDVLLVSVGKDGFSYQLYLTKKRDIYTPARGLELQQVASHSTAASVTKHSDFA